MRMAESRNEILRISRRDRKHDKKEYRYLRIKKSQIAMSCLEQYEPILNRRRKYLCVQCSS